MGDTKENIILAASRLFSTKGLKAVTVREICQAAGVNVAMINYHFRDKSGLYRVCIERLLLGTAYQELTELADKVRDARSWKAAIRSWVCAFSRTLRTTTGGTALMAGFFHQEVTNPSPMSDLIRERYVQPAYDSLSRLFGMAVADADERRRWVESVWAQLSAYAMVDSSWHKVFRPVGAAAEEWRDEFADFVCRRVFAELKYMSAK